MQEHTCCKSRRHDRNRGVLGAIGARLETLALAIDVIGVAIIVFGFVISLIARLRTLAGRVGFRLGRDPHGDQFVHGCAIGELGPSGGEAALEPKS